jgi:tetratricopeptide (TPR) repeat protein
MMKFKLTSLAVKHVGAMAASVAAGFVSIRDVVSGSAHSVTSSACFASFVSVLAIVFIVPSFAHAHGAYHDVVVEVSKALETSPDDAALHFRLACAHQEHGEWTAAMVELEIVERLAPEKYETAYVQGQALATGGRLKAAKDVLNGFLREQPEHVGAHEQRARVLVKLGEPKPAVTDYEFVLAHLKMPKAELILETVDAMQAAEMKDEASALLRKHALREGADPEIVAKLLEQAEAAPEPDEALALMSQMERQALQPEVWMARRARLLAKAGRDADARTAWTSLHARIAALPSLKRGSPPLAALFSEAQQALGIKAVAPVIAPPAAR